MRQYNTLQVTTASLCALALALLLQSCATMAARPTSGDGSSDAPGDMGSMEGSSAPDPVGASAGAGPSAATRADVEYEISQIEKRKQGYMEDFGVEGGAAPNAGAEVTGCKEICDLQEAICGSSSRICQIAADYPAEPWFAERCTWSEDECTQARTTCDRCQP